MCAAAYGSLPAVAIPHFIATLAARVFVQLHFASGVIIDGVVIDGVVIDWVVA